ncbi:MAG: hypothetical protein AB7Q42_20880 [Acidimicrobiia bacterium]
MADLALPASLKTEMDDLKRRLSAMEMAPRLQTSSLSAGTLSLLDSDRQVIVRIGVQPDGRESAIDFYDPATGRALVSLGEIAPNVYGIRVVNDAGRPIFGTSADGQTSPYAPFTWTPSPDVPHDANGRPTVTSTGTWLTLAQAYVYATALYATPSATFEPAGSPHDVRFTAAEFGASAQTLFTATGVTSSTPIAASGNLDGSGTVDGGDPLGRLYVFKLEARRTSGAGVGYLKINSNGFLSP